MYIQIMKNLDDGPDGLNDEAFDRMLGVKRTRRRARPATAVTTPTPNKPMADVVADWTEEWARRVVENKP